MTKTISILLTFSLFPLATLGQLGDKKDKGDAAQVDPIPANLIPQAPFLSLSEAMQAFDLAEGFVIEPVASEPLVENPVAIAFDPNGRMWVAEMRSYMPDLDGNGEDTPNGRIRILEDTDGDGRMDKSTDFLNDLVLPRLVSFSHGGVIFNNGDALYYIKRDGLKPVGPRELIDQDYAKGGNPEHKANGMLYGHDNWFYNAKSSSRYRRIEGKWIKEKTATRGQFGISKDNAGRLFYNSNSTLLVGDAFTPGFLDPMRANQVASNRVYPSRINPGVNRAYRENTLNKAGKLVNATGACGPLVYRGDNFPEPFRNYAFVSESSANLVKAIQLGTFENFEHTGTHPYREKEFLTSTDERFRPVNNYTAPDGTLIILDMYHGLIQHKAYVTTYLRNQYASRDLDKHNNDAGRIYRVRWKEKPVSKVPALEDKPAAEILPFLAHPNGFWRDTAQRLLVEIGDASLVPALNEMAGDDSKPLGQIHALWTLEGLSKVNASAVEAALRSSDSNVLMTGFEVAPSCENDSKESVIDSCIQTIDTSNAYKARCLARLGSERTWLALLKIIDNQIDSELIRDTVVTALGTELGTFRGFLKTQSGKSVQRFSAELADVQKALRAKKRENKIS
jgi:glucose/arabinose dehydrogenase